MRAQPTRGRVLCFRFGFSCFVASCAFAWVLVWIGVIEAAPPGIQLSLASLLFLLYLGCCYWTCCLSTCCGSFCSK